ncbi:prohibitin family protein [Haloarculaceae archaeon H-GB2-1]|nr:prohibitin family protein [Haloarculaceae archaeon H-GB1-1]MEA5409222.1 prohibitin family protein [Haloarculaceae archaeon H-GB2-1]
MALIGGGLAFETVDEGHVKVVKNQGAVTGTALKPGWLFITPFVESTVTIPTRPQTYTMSHQSGEGTKATKDDSIRVLTNDGLQVDVDVTVRYRVTAATAPEFHSRYRNMETAEIRLIRPTVRSTLRTQGGNLDVTNIYTGEGQTALRKAVRNALVQQFDGSGLTLEAVQIRNVRLPSDYAKSIEQKKIKQQKIEEAQYEIKVAQKQKERKKIEAEAEATKIRIKGKGLRNNPEVLQLRYIEALKSNGNTVYVTGDSGLTLTKEVEPVANETGGSNASASP